MSDNPIVTVDFSKHPMYNSDYYRERGYNGKFKAEVLMLNINSGSIRVRLLNDDGTYFKKNIDTSLCYVIEDELLVNLR